MKYRIKKEGYKFYPQYQVWYNLYIWSPFIEYNSESEENRHVFFITLEEADKYINQKKKDNEIIFYKR